MNRDQFLRELRRYCRKADLPQVGWNPRKGKGGHGRVTVGAKFTTVPSGELKNATVRGILYQLGLPQDALD